MYQFTDVSVEILKYILVFVAMIATDYIWSEWMKSVSEKKAIRAGLFSIGTVLAGSFVIISYIENPKYLIPACLGAFVGTYISVRYNGKKEKLEKSGEVSD
jgi:hypothetical protein